MTTVVLARNKDEIILGADSRATFVGSAHVVTKKKIRECHLGTFAVAGQMPIWRKKWDTVKTPRELIFQIVSSTKNTECIFIASRNRVYLGTSFNGMCCVDRLPSDVFAMGSGGGMAHGFMLGSDLPIDERLKKALDLASLHDKHTHGPFDFFTQKIVSKKAKKIEEVAELKKKVEKKKVKLQKFEDFKAEREDAKEADKQADGAS